MNHYAYVIYKESTGEYYIGIRSCPANVSPHDDPYMGSPCLEVRQRIKTEGDWYKYVITQSYATRKELVRSEPNLIRGHLNNGLCLNKSVGGSDGWNQNNLSKEARERWRCALKAAMDKPEYKAKQSIAQKRAKCRPCTVDGVVIFPSRDALIQSLGHGKQGRRSATFRYVPINKSSASKKRPSAS